ncbi:MAG TPA: hypothetical protein VIA11_00395 [Acidimicrobiia bacterium]|nr:hypothetical protein [Acidimicrobiia bacterium]
MADRRWFKGRAARELDRWYRDGDVGQNLIYARDVLRDVGAFEAIVRRLNDEGRWSTDEIYSYPRQGALVGPEFEAVARQGYLEAIALARRHDPPVPIVTYWMNGVENETFEMHVADDTAQVAVTIVIPNDPIVFDREGPESWIVTVEGDTEVKVTQTSGPPDQPQPSTTDSD